jgi:hypothetical protein
MSRVLSECRMRVIGTREDRKTSVLWISRFFANITIVMVIKDNGELDPFELA